MAQSIVEIIRSNLGYSGLEKVDPNSQDIKANLEPADKLHQGAITAVLTGLYTFTRTDDGCNMVISGKDREDWLSVIFRGQEAAVVEKLTRYSGATTADAERELDTVAPVAIFELKRASGEPLSCEKVRNYMTAQRHNILVYLPASLEMGSLLNDEVLDDKTNKMEGPVSNFMHKIENVLSKGGSETGTF